MRTPTPSPHLTEAVRRRAMNLAIPQGIFATFGTWLMGGMFLSYFALELGAPAKMLGIILAIGSLSGVLRIIAPHFVNRSNHRKKVWLLASLLARSVAVGLPMLAFPNLRPVGIDPLWLLVLLLAGMTIASTISDVAWLSWYADVVPEERWGRYFGLRNAWMAPAAMFVQFTGALAVDAYVSSHPETKLNAYAGLYACGILCHVVAVIPLLWAPNIPLAARPEGRASLLPQLLAPFRDVNFRRYAYFHCWLMLGGGITQTAFNKYPRDYLELSLLGINLYLIVNRLFDLLGSRLAGPLSDRFGNKPLIVVGLIGAAAGPFFWIPTRPGQTWPLLIAYVIWGVDWAMVNLCGQNLMLKVAPRENNVAYIAAAQGIGGLCLAFSIIVGGFWLDALLAVDYHVVFGGLAFNAFHVFFLMSFVARSTAALWVFSIREPRARSVTRVARTLVRWQGRRRATRSRRIHDRTAVRPDGRPL